MQLVVSQQTEVQGQRHGAADSAVVSLLSPVSPQQHALPSFILYRSSECRIFMETRIVMLFISEKFALRASIRESIASQLSNTVQRK